MKRGTQRSLGAFYLGLIANEVAGRGIAHKKTRAQQNVILKTQPEKTYKQQENYLAGIAVRLGAKRLGVRAVGIAKGLGKRWKAKRHIKDVIANAQRARNTRIAHRGFATLGIKRGGRIATAQRAQNIRMRQRGTKIKKQLKKIGQGTGTAVSVGFTGLMAKEIISEISPKRKYPTQSHVAGYHPYHLKRKGKRYEAAI